MQSDIFDRGSNWYPAVRTLDECRLIVVARTSRPPVTPTHLDSIMPAVLHAARYHGIAIAMKLLRRHAFR